MGCEDDEGADRIFQQICLHLDKLEFHKDANMLKGGLVYADYITTVSDSGAQEIQTDYYGEGLDGLFAARHFDMRGIVNGIDYKTYDRDRPGNL